MKKLILIIVCAISLSCTDNARVKNYSGTETINLPKGEKLIIATWKERNIWYLTERMPDNYIPSNKTFNEKSSYGVFNSTIIFVESK